MRGWIGLCRRAIGRASALAGLALALAVGLSACDNDPWPGGAAGSNMLYTSMIENTPRHLDPTASYWSNDTAVTYQVY
ncbi:MAG: hypothetical protein KGK09_09285, partial [Burkholderiales bacterium]|nr:hypothetical protein [Burkholderiales bacterium]